MKTLQEIEKLITDDRNEAADIQTKFSHLDEDQKKNALKRINASNNAIPASGESLPLLSEEIAGKSILATSCRGDEALTCNPLGKTVCIVVIAAWCFCCIDDRIKLYKYVIQSKIIP